MVSYTNAVDAARNVFLGILGHDLRTPLTAISLSAEVLLNAADLPPKATKNVTRIFTSVKRSIKIVGDLLDFTRTHLGSGIPVRKDNDDLALICAGMVEEARAYHPERQIDLVADASLPGLFDRSRMEQVIGNLIGNAIEHGTADTPVTVVLKDDDGIAVLSIHNDAPPIEASARASLFNPMVRHHPSGHLLYGAGLGLGLSSPPPSSALTMGALRTTPKPGAAPPSPSASP